MKRPMTRREFLSLGTKSLLGTMAITACGTFVPFRSEAANRKEIQVDDSNYIINVEALKQEKAVDFVFEGKRCILLFNNGKTKAFENICTHRKGPNKLKGERLVCQWHGATFDPLTGKALTKPAPSGSGLKEIPLVVREGKIFVA